MANRMPNGVTMDEPEQVRIRKLVDALGEVKASEHLGVDRLTTLRALSGLPLRARTADHLRRILAQPASVVDNQLSLVA